MSISTLFRRSASKTPKVSAFFRRSIPAPSKEIATSWLGGLPRMPENIAWPSPSPDTSDSDAQNALHFLAQIDCAELPPNIWNGLAPKSGALLFFANMHQGFDEDFTSNDFRVLYVEQAGPERQPPDGIRPVHDPFYSGFPFGDIYGPPEMWPRHFRKWPVEVIAGDPDRFEPHGGKMIEGYYEASAKQRFKPANDAILKLLANRQLTYGLSSQLVTAAAQKMKNLARSIPNIDSEEANYFARTTAAEFWDAEFAKLDKMETDDGERLELYKKEGWISDPSKVPSHLSALSTIRYNLQWAADKRAAFKRQHDNPHFVDDMKSHFEIKRQCARWAAELAPRIDALASRLKKGKADQNLAKDDAEIFRTLVFRQFFTSRQISWVVESKEDVVTPLGGNKNVALILREELTDRYLQDREDLSEFIEDLENLESYFRYVEDVHCAGTRPPDYKPDHIVLLQLVSDTPMQWVFSGRLVFTIAPDALRNMDFSRAQMHLSE